jgi:hypothetical protein
MFAPLRNAPWVIESEVLENTSMNCSGPAPWPPELTTRSPAGRRREKLKPVPPPAFWMSAVALTASKMPSTESSTGSTKHADSIPSRRPAFVRHGLFGRNMRSAISV